MAAKFTRFSEKRDTTASDVTSYDDAVDGIEPDESAGLHIPIPKNNMGFVLMQKMGWSTSGGLGKNEQGRKDPIPLELKGDNMGLGRFQMELDLASEATEKRKQLEIEKELTPGLIDKYKAQVAKELAIADATQDLRKTYHCELCEKQYNKYSEYDNHLNSYDHHHRQRLKDLKQFETGLKTKAPKGTAEEIQQKKASLKAVAKERAQMKVERYQQLLEGGDLPGFKPMDFRKKRQSSSSSSAPDMKPVVDVAAMIESREAIVSALRKRKSEEIAESERKIAEKKGRLAKYGVKFQSAGHLATIGSEEMSSYQSNILSTSLQPSTTSSESTATSSSSGLYAGRFVSAGEMKEIKEGEDEREKRLSELPQASGRKAELHMAAAKKEEKEEKEGESDDDEEEDFTLCARKRILRDKEEKEKKNNQKKQSKQMTLKLTDKYESYYY